MTEFINCFFRGTAQRSIRSHIFKLFIGIFSPVTPVDWRAFSTIGLQTRMKVTRTSLNIPSCGSFVGLLSDLLPEIVSCEKFIAAVAVRRRAS